MKIRPVGGEFFHADAKTAGYDKTLRKILRTRLKIPHSLPIQCSYLYVSCLSQKKHGDYFPIQH